MKLVEAVLVVDAVHVPGHGVARHQLHQALFFVDLGDRVDGQVGLDGGGPGMVRKNRLQLRFRRVDGEVGDAALRQVALTRAV